MAVFTITIPDEIVNALNPALKGVQDSRRNEDGTITQGIIKYPNGVDDWLPEAVATQVDGLLAQMPHAYPAYQQAIVAEETKRRERMTMLKPAVSRGDDSENSTPVLTRK